MEDIQEQLAALRRRIAQVERKPYPRPTGSLPPRPSGKFIEELMSGQVVSTPHGEHFETEKVWERHRRHGSVDISDLAELPEDLLDPLSEGAITRAHPTRWAFLDTETTGLAGGAGTYAFLIGVGSIDGSGFRLRQFFMRDYGEEASLLFRLAEYLAAFDVLITYNGKAYDQPLLETRYRLVRARTPFDRMQHLDLLFGARRLWKLRLESCRLVDLENRVLGVERHGDLPGSLIPYCYFDYLRSRRAMPLVPIFDHNATDILSLACLTAIVPFAFRTEGGRPMGHGLSRRGPDRAGAMDVAGRAAGGSPEPVPAGCRNGAAGRSALSDHVGYRCRGEAAGTCGRGARDGYGIGGLAQPVPGASPGGTGEALRAPRAELRHGAKDDARRARL